MEIGSEFWLEKQVVVDYDDKIPHWLKKYGDIVLTSSGRGAISLVLDQVDPKIKRVLLPSYVCDSVLLPFEKAGYELIYYDVDKQFKPQKIEIENIDIGIFFHMGYFGFQTNQILNDTISKLRARSVIIIEDVTHTLFSSYQKPMDNDFVIGSIRKWFGVPSGGFVASSKIINAQLLYPPNEFIDLRISSLKMKFEYIKTLNKSLKDSYLVGFRKAEQILDEDVDSYRIDRMSEMIIKYINIDKIEKVRRSNFQFLLKHLKDVKGIEVVFQNIKYDVIPIFFPIYINHNRDKLRSDLISKEIYCPIHWSFPNQLEGHLSSETKEIYDSILSIPCDQRYGIKDMKRIIDVIKELV